MVPRTRAILVRNERASLIVPRWNFCRRRTLARWVLMSTQSQGAFIAAVCATRGCRLIFSLARDGAANGSRSVSEVNKQRRHRRPDSAGLGASDVITRLVTSVGSPDRMCEWLPDETAKIFRSPVVLWSGIPEVWGNIARLIAPYAI